MEERCTCVYRRYWRQTGSLSFSTRVVQLPGGTPISPRTPPACVFTGFTNPRWLATLRSPGANILHAFGVQTSSPKGLLVFLVQAICF